MELRHLRYFVAVAEALNFTKASARLRVAQPALSRQMTDLEDEIGVDLMKRSPRGVTLTAEGKLFLDEVRELLKRADESVEKVRALARGEYGDHRSGGRTRGRTIQHNFQTRGRQTPALPPTHRYDGSGVRGHRPRHKGRRNARRREVLRNPAQNLEWSDRGQTQAGEVLNEARAFL